jgi:predicted DNA binding CopG/RHH family protein
MKLDKYEQELENNFDSQQSLKNIEQPKNL